MARNRGRIDSMRNETPDRSNDPAQRNDAPYGHSSKVQATVGEGVTETMAQYETTGQ